MMYELPENKTTNLIVRASWQLALLFFVILDAGICLQKHIKNNKNIPPNYM